MLRVKIAIEGEERELALNGTAALVLVLQEDRHDVLGGFMFDAIDGPRSAERSHAAAALRLCEPVMGSLAIAMNRLYKRREVTVSVVSDACRRVAGQGHLAIEAAMDNRDVCNCQVAFVGEKLPGAGEVKKPQGEGRP